MSDLKNFDLSTQEKNVQNELTDAIAKKETSIRSKGLRELGKAVWGGTSKKKNAKGSKILYNKKQITKREEKREKRIWEQRKIELPEQ